MSNINLFSTQVTQSGTGQTQALSGAQTGLTSGVAGLAFWNILFGDILENNSAEDEKTTLEGIKEKIEKGIQESDLLLSESSEKKISDLSVLQSLLNGDAQNDNIDGQLKDLKVERLVQFLDGLTNGTPKNLETMVNKEEGAEALLMLITSGLNPSEISEVNARILEVERKLGRELTLDDIVAGIGNIIPSNDGDDNAPLANFLGTFLKDTQKPSSNNVPTEINGSDIALNNLQTAGNTSEEKNGILETGGNETTNKNNAGAGNDTPIIFKDVDIKHRDIMAQEIKAPDQISTASGIDINDTDAIPYEFGGLLAKNPLQQNSIIKNSDLINGIKITASINQGSVSNTANMVAAVKLDPLALQNLSFDSVHTDFFTDGFLLEDGIEYHIQNGIPFSNTMQAAHAVTMTPQAGQAHPATQMVAMTLTKAAKSGETQEMTLQLDPPELGRVEVKMQFNADRDMSASFMVEEVETFMMLQRDTHVLEKALQDAGIDTANQTIHFELAENGYFSDDRQHANEHNNSKSGNRDSKEIEVIETDLTWMVDPQTGHVHYNILA